MKSNLYAATTVSTYSHALQLYQEPHAPEVIAKKLAQLSKELEKMRHRGYTEASLKEPAGQDSVYYGSRNGEGYISELAGTVVKVYPDEFIVLSVQNPFDNQSCLEILSFDGQIIPLPTQEMCDLKRRPLTKSKPNTLIILPFVQNIHELNLARMPVAVRS